MNDVSTTLKNLGVNITSLKFLEHPVAKQIPCLSVYGSEVIQQWQTLRELVGQTRHWPVILGNDDALERHLEFFKHGTRKEPEVILREAELVDPHEWLTYTLDGMFADDEDFSVDDLRGDWPDEVQHGNEFVAPYDLRTGALLPEVHIALVPATSSWHVPAILGFGGWNSCPEPHEHVSLLRYWHERYGVEVVSMLPDSIELNVSRPPDNPEQALALAFEHYAYCPDIVDQGVETIDALAATLLNGAAWFFWWD